MLAFALPAGPPVFIHEERLGARIIGDAPVSETDAEIPSGFTDELIVLRSPPAAAGRSALFRTPPNSTANSNGPGRRSAA